LKITPGEKIALVGVNGAGKTTFVKLLCRFYDPDEGRIMIGGHDLKEIDLEGWYNQLGAIFQDYSRYHLIVKEAIAIGRSGQASSLEKVKEAAQASEADTFIEEWEKKYQSMLGKEFTEGIEPSIGQWQKLALARTFYRDPKIMILDEPTSSIDAEAEAKIFEKLELLPSDRTVILISHRFSTVRQADKIGVIMEKGLQELGTHQDLLKLNGTYAKLFNLQAKGYK
jgi:ATP-binding cassette subfamily B protein